MDNLELQCMIVETENGRECQWVGISESGDLLYVLDAEMRPLDLCGADVIAGLQVGYDDAEEAGNEVTLDDIGCYEAENNEFAQAEWLAKVFDVEDSQCLQLRAQQVFDAHFDLAKEEDQ